MEHGLAGYILGCRCRNCRNASQTFRRERKDVPVAVKPIVKAVKVPEPDPFAKQDLSIADLARMAVWR